MFYDRHLRSEFFDDRLSRRAVMSGIARSTLGVSLMSGWSSLLEAAPSAGGKHAKQVIYFYMSGAMSHIDTFDPKPGTDVQGEIEPINTKTPGIQFGQYMTNLADLQDKIAVVRSMTTETADHEKGRYWLRTSYPMLASIRHPSMGSWIVNAMGKLSDTLPPFVLVGNGNDHPGSGFLDPSLTPVPVADPKRGIENTTLPGYLTEKAFKRRLDLADKIDKKFKARYAGQQIESYNQMYKEAVRLMGSTDLEAFDISKEPEEMQERYGDSRVGLGALLARRLVEAGVRFVEIEFGSWDMHDDVAGNMEERGSQLDQALGSLIRDLDSRGLLSETLIVLTTEFGRSPTINQNAGRDHHPAAFSYLLAGAGIKGGAVHGKSDERGHGVDEDPVGLTDFNTTIAAACGLDYKKEQIAPNGRPFKIGGGGDPIESVLA
jgi:hypothetical protein